MLAASRKWLNRNRSYFAVGAGVVGAGYMAGQYVVSKFTESRQRMSEQRLAKDNLRRRFQQNQEDCNFTVLAIISSATANIFEQMPVENTLRELQQHKAERVSRSNAGSEAASSIALSAPPSTVGDEDGTSRKSEPESPPNADAPTRPRKSKSQLWDQMKIESISRSFALLYTVALLIVVTRIQLNLLGRRNYLASVVSMAMPRNANGPIRLQDDEDNLENSYSSDYGTVRKFLSFSWWLLNQGCLDILKATTEAVEEVFGPVNPREEVSLQRLSELTIEVRKRIEGATDKDRKKKRWLAFLLPPTEQEEFLLRESKTVAPDVPSKGLVTPALRRLLNETADWIDHPSFSSVLTHLLDAGFTHLTHGKVAPTAFKTPALHDGQGPSEAFDPNLTKAKLASCLAVYCRQAALIGAGDSGMTVNLSAQDALAVSSQGNEYVAAMEGVPKLGIFSAVVYSSNFEYETAEPLDSLPSVSLSQPAPEKARSLAAAASLAQEQPAPALPAKADPQNYAWAFAPNGPGMVSLGPSGDSVDGEAVIVPPPQLVAGPVAEPVVVPAAPVREAEVDFDAVWNRSAASAADAPRLIPADAIVFPADESIVDAAEAASQAGPQAGSERQQVDGILAQPEESQPGPTAAPALDSSQSHPQAGISIEVAESAESNQATEEKVEVAATPVDDGVPIKSASES